MRRNPFQSALSLRFSNYCLSVQRDLKYYPKDPELGRLTLEVFHELQERIVDDAYPCVGARAAFRQEAYRFGVYPEMNTAEATAGLAHDLFTFLQERKRIGSGFTTFLAAFAGPADAREAEFEVQLWEQLDRLHGLDREHHRWDPAVSSDPRDPHFGYSFAETACFVVGMHAHSSRMARRFPYPLLIFNTHAQFDQLREKGTYRRMQAVIRKRERMLQGSLNPMLDDFGARSEARQYSGRAVKDGWTCPFHAHSPRAEAPSEREAAPSGESA